MSVGSLCQGDLLNGEGPHILPFQEIPVPVHGGAQGTLEAPQGSPSELAGCLVAGKSQKFCFLGAAPQAAAVVAAAARSGFRLSTSNKPTTASTVSILKAIR